MATDVERNVAQTKMTELLAENERLKAKVANLQDRLEIAEAPILDECPDGYHEHRLWFTDNGWAAVKRVLVFRGLETERVIAPREIVAGAIAATCDEWLVRKHHDHATCKSADKLKHAGLEYLATEMDWAQAAKQYSGYPAELIVFVQALAVERDEHAVAELVAEFYADPEASFSDERV